MQGRNVDAEGSYFFASSPRPFIEEVKVMIIKDYYGHLVNKDLDYKGYFPDGTFIICESEREYHRLFDEKEKEDEED